MAAVAGVCLAVIATVGAGVASKDVAVGTATIGNDAAAGGVTIALGSGGELMSAVPTPYPYTIWPPKWPI